MGAVVLLSGGWDSAACAVLALREWGQDLRSLFVNYGQPYLFDEQRASADVAKSLGVSLLSNTVDSIEEKDGVFPGRNDMLVRLALKEASTVYVGARNPLASLDRFGDSNWKWARGWRSRGVDLRTPLIGWPKFFVRRLVTSAGVDSSVVYSTEFV